MTAKLSHSLVLFVLCSLLAGVLGEHLVDCDAPLMGQYECFEPEIDPETQQPFNCLKNNTVFKNCTLIDGLLCKHTLSPNFTVLDECLYTNGYHFETALLLSIFLGGCGSLPFVVIADRN